MFINASLSEKASFSKSPLRHATILAITLGPRLSWALHHRDGTIKKGSSIFRSTDFEGVGMGYLRFRYFLEEIYTKSSNLDAVVFADVREHMTVHDAMVFGGFFAHLTAWCEWRYIPYINASLAAAKRLATGQDDPHVQRLVTSLRNRGYAMAERDSAEALALLDWAMHYDRGIRK